MNLVGLSVYVCVCVNVFQSHQKYQIHEILALGLIWANLKKLITDKKKPSANLTPRTMKLFTNSKIMRLFMISSAIKHQSSLEF